MSSTRTQVYLTEEQRARIDAITAADGVTLAEVVRRSLDAYLERELPDPRIALRDTFGVDTDIEPPDRSEWDRG
ncbi:MAG: CopG family transcriptional regulator [Acidimicrobiales bacterium]